MWQILLVDEDRHAHQLLTKSCAGLREVVQAGSASEAQRLLRARPIHLVVLEHRLPDSSGLDLVAVLKARWPRRPRSLGRRH